MFLIIGYVVILASSLGTYAVHGSLAALWVPTEYIAIVGLTIGGFLAGNDIKHIKATVAALPSVLKGSPYNKALYMDVLGMLFEILSKVRKEGLMSIEGDVENPEASPIFSKYPNVMADHHVQDFVTDYLRMMVGGNLNSMEIEALDLLRPQSSFLLLKCFPVPLIEWLDPLWAGNLHAAFGTTKCSVLRLLVSPLSLSDW